MTRPAISAPGPVMFLADLHGSACWTAAALEIFESEAETLVILGDILSAGGWPPECHDPRETALLLNRHAERITAVRGNCDRDSDAEKLAFPLHEPDAVLESGGRRLLLAHGHLGPDPGRPAGEKADAFVHGHTHLARAERVNGLHVLNPGSLSLPRRGLPHTFGLLRGTVFSVLTLEGETSAEIDLTR